MTEHNDGGAAFPTSVLHLTPSGYTTTIGAEDGMTLRDWFAGQALASFVPDTPQNKAEAAYAIADAMIAARSPKAQQP